jgi:YhgE/Pip-like protein
VHNLPVMVVNQDRGAEVGGQRLNIGQQVQVGITASPAVSSRLQLQSTSLTNAERTIDRGRAYTMVVIPENFTATLLTVAGLPVGAPAAGQPEIAMLANQRAGTVGASLATGVLQPALDVASRQTGQRLTSLVPAARSNAASRAVLTDPLTITTATYRPLPSNSGLGLSAFYLALLTLICGFLVGTVLHTSVDVALGYATTEIGPRWRQRQPLPITRWRTLPVRWAMALPLAAVVTAIMLAVAVAGLGMNAPRVGLLWLFAWLCTASVAAGTLVLFAVLGTPGQLAALLVFVYLGLASAGGTVPLKVTAHPASLDQRVRAAAPDPRRDPVHPLLRRPRRRRTRPRRARRLARAAVLDRDRGSRDPLVRPPWLPPSIACATGLHRRRRQELPGRHGRAGGGRLAGRPRTTGSAPSGAPAARTPRMTELETGRLPAADSSYPPARQRPASVVRERPGGSAGARAAFTVTGTRTRASASRYGSRGG